MKDLFWIASSKDDLSSFPKAARYEMGFALEPAQRGGKSPDAKPLTGFKGAGVLEVVDDHRGDTYRAVYTVKFKDALYVLHAFKKKSKSGIATPKHHIELIRDRLKSTEIDHAQRYGAKIKGKTS